MMQEENFIVLVGGQRISVPRQMTEVSQYLSSILFIGQGEEEVMMPRLRLRLTMLLSLLIPFRRFWNSMR
jgi:hypothetical protein